MCFIKIALTLNDLKIFAHFVVISRLSLRFMKNFKQDKRPKRQSKLPSFESDPETQEVLIFIYEKLFPTTTFSNRAWPRGYSDETKLALRQGQYEFISHKILPHRMMYLG